MWRKEPRDIRSRYDEGALISGDIMGEYLSGCADPEERRVVVIRMNEKYRGGSDGGGLYDRAVLRANNE